MIPPKQSVILKRCPLPVLLLFALLAHCTAAQAKDLRDDKPQALMRFEVSKKRMGVKFNLVVYAKTVEQARAGIVAVFQRIGELEDAMSDYDPDSELMKLCRNSHPGRPQKVSHDLFAVLSAAEKINRLSDGCFDPTIGQLSKLWRAARKSKKIPSQLAVQQARSSVNWGNVILNSGDQTVTFKRKGIQLDLGGIAKGYAADQAVQCFREKKLSICLVNASGDVTAGDPPPGKRGWTVAISNAEGKKITIANSSVASSGDRYQFLEYQGQRFSHIIDPKTGWGVTSRRLVTVVSKDRLAGTMADGWASAVSVMPLKKIEQIAGQLKGCSIMVQTVNESSKPIILFQNGDLK